MNYKFVRIVVAVAALFLIGACAKSNAIEVGEVAPDFSLADSNGKTLSSADFKGKVVILDFFASWCPPCREEIPDFIALQNTYRDKGFSMVGISLVDPKETKSFAASMGINYPVAADDGKVSGFYGPIRSIPTTFVIGKDSVVKKVYIGYRPKEVFEQDIQELLK